MRSFQAKEAFKLALSMTLFYWLALWMNWDMPKYGALAIILISLGTSGASLQKGVLRIIGTTAGLAVGLAALVFFAQDRWGNMLFQAAYLVVVGYFLLGSRFGYAWFVAGFLPPLVWGTTYMKVDTAFDYAVFRYLETSAGVIIYTVVSVLLWPRTAGEQLNRQGTDLWAGLRTLFALYRDRLTGAHASSDATSTRFQIAGTLAQMRVTLQAAYADTPDVSARKRVWEIQRVNVRALSDALALWAVSVDDCRKLDLGRLLPRLDSVLDTLNSRLERTSALWEARDPRAQVSDVQDRDDPLLQPVGLEVDRSAIAGVSHFDRAALMSFVRQLTILDTTSREVLRTMRVLAGLDPSRGFRPSSIPPDLYRPSRWSPQRLIKACFPALCFVVAYIVWIMVNPPAGPGMVYMAAVFSLLLLMTWMSPIPMMVSLLGSMAIIVAPVYFLLMPRLDTGLGLLTLVFLYTFVFGWLGGRKPVLKTMPLVAFFTMVGITNQQSYSFTGLVDAGQMLALALGLVAVIQMLFSPMQPEKAMLHDLRRFFRGCARITAAYGRDHLEDPAPLKRRRERDYESMVAPVPQRLQAVVKNLDFSASPEDSPEKIQRLASALESVALGMQALEMAHTRLATRSLASTEPIVSQGRQLRDLVQQVFYRWARFDLAGVPDEHVAAEQLSGDLQQRLETIAGQAQREQPNDHLLGDLYAIVGSARRLIGAMSEARLAMSAINWDRWREDRFP